MTFFFIKRNYFGKSRINEWNIFTNGNLSENWKKNQKFSSKKIKCKLNVSLKKISRFQIEINQIFIKIKKKSNFLFRMKILKIFENLYFSTIEGGRNKRNLMKIISKILDFHLLFVLFLACFIGTVKLLSYNYFNFIKISPNLCMKLSQKIWRCGKILHKEQLDSKAE